MKCEEAQQREHYLEKEANSLPAQIQENHFSFPSKVAAQPSPPQPSQYSWQLQLPRGLPAPAPQALAGLAPIRAVQGPGSPSSSATFLIARTVSRYRSLVISSLKYVKYATVFVCMHVPVSRLLLTDRKDAVTHHIHQVI